MTGTPRATRSQVGRRFDILYGELDTQGCLRIPTILPGDHGSESLKKLPVDNQVLARRRSSSPGIQAKFQFPSRASRDSLLQDKVPLRGTRRRPSLDVDTFTPLEEVQKERAAYFRRPDLPFVPRAATQQSPRSTVLSICDIEKHDSSNGHFKHTVEEQVNKQLTGQFDWIMTYPAPARPAGHRRSRAGRKPDGPPGEMTFGCNLLRRGQYLSSTTAYEENPSANTYTFIATPLEAGNATLMPAPEASQELEAQADMALFHQSTHREVTLKAPEVIQAVEQAVSPSLTQVSESSGFMDRSSRGGSFSAPRIEDSLEELDKLEDELEAVSAVTDSRRAGADEEQKPEQTPDTSSAARESTSTKRVTISTGQPSAVRAKPTGKLRPALRRSSSLTLRDEKKSDSAEPVPEQKAAGTSITRSKSTNTRPTDLRTPFKSTKPPTVSKFELPGEAVSRRLKEQREVRQTQKAEAQRAKAQQAERVRSSKPPTKPTFELPGEAISRRKREERESRLKVQEEEERKRREFKARPFKQSLTPKTLPRETIASRARQGNLPSEETPKSQAEINRAKRVSTTNPLSGPATGASAAKSTQAPRGRNSMILASDDGSRATSVSTSMSEKRSSVSAEEIVHQRARGKEIYARDNSYMQDRTREKREREAAARFAREQAAERSRAASREWAEKKRQRDQARKEAMRSRELAQAK